MFLVLIFGIVPPLIAWAIISAAEAAVERTRIRLLGLEDPLAAAEALNDLKLREQTPTAMMTALSVGGVGVGVMALIIVLSVMSGFEADLQKKILGTNSHGVVMKYTPDMPEYEDVLEQGQLGEGHHRRDAVHPQRGDGLQRGQHLRRDDQGHRPEDGRHGHRSRRVPAARRRLAGLARRPVEDQARRLAPLGGAALDEDGRGGDGSRAEALDGGEGEAPPARQPKGFVSDVERDPLIDLPSHAPATPSRCCPASSWAASSPRRSRWWSAIG